MGNFNEELVAIMLAGEVIDIRRPAVLHRERAVIDEPFRIRLMASGCSR
jgi:hypothetical protein